MVKLNLVTVDGEGLCNEFERETTCGDAIIPWYAKFSCVTDSAENVVGSYTLCMGNMLFLQPDLGSGRDHRFPDFVK